MRSWMIAALVAIPPALLLPALPPRPVTLALALLGLLPLLPWRGRGACCRRWIRPACGCAAGIALTLCAGHGLEARRLPLACEGQPLSVTGRVASLARETRMPDGALRRRFEFAVESVAPARCAGPRRLLLASYDGAALAPGQRWRLPVRLKRPWGMANPGSFNMQAWYAASAIDAVGGVRRGAVARLAVSGPGSAGAAAGALRRAVTGRIAALELPAESRAMLRALTVGDRSGLDFALWSLVQSLGISHLLVISGLHIGMVALPGWLVGALLQRLLWSCGRFRHSAMLAPACALAAGLGYAALAGFSLSTVRAVTMLAGASLARLAGRHGGVANGLLLAAALLLFGNPLLALSSGFWLSFGAVALLLALAALRPDRGSMRRRIVGSHLFMSLAMLPMAGWWFGGASLISAPVNAVLVPLVGLLVVPLALAGTLLSVCGSGLDAVLWRWAVWPLQQCLDLARGVVDSGDPWFYPQFAPGPLAAALSVPALLLLLPRGRPALVLPGLALALPLLLSGLRVAERDPALTVTVLDVGQGTAVLLRQGRDTLLYDTGGGDPAGVNAAGSVILPYLRGLGVRRLDRLVVSHPDADHSAGVDALHRGVAIDRVLFGGGVAPVAGALPCRAGLSWRWPGGARFRVLAPARETGLSSNDGSCVLQVGYAGHRLLLPGDVGRAREGELVRYWGPALRSDWLLVGHHGSATSTSHAWLKAVRPRVAVLSRGRGNRFGHPHPQVLRRLAAYGAAVEDTAASGALEFRVSRQGMSLRRRRDEVRRFWM